MARLLFVSWYGAGNQGPAIAVARAMAERGHEIVFAGYANQRELFEGKGFEFRLLVRADAGYPKRTPPEGWLPSLVAAVWACPPISKTSLPYWPADPATRSWWTA